ncbi:MAG: hypothetical protein GY711_09640 [bacterium]|nr:hypothetical protein [bacterium]
MRWLSIAFVLCGLLNTWSSIPPAPYEHLLAECRRQGVRVRGHVPSRVGLRGVLASGQGSLAHVEEEKPVVINTPITYAMIAARMARPENRYLDPMLLELWGSGALGLWGSDQDDWRKTAAPGAGEASFLVAAYQHAAAGRLDDAARVAEASARLHAESYRSPYFVAGLLEMAGKEAEAQKHLERVEELLPRHPLSRWR